MAKTYHFLPISCNSMQTYLCYVDLVPPDSIDKVIRKLPRVATDPNPDLRLLSLGFFVTLISFHDAIDFEQTIIDSQRSCGGQEFLYQKLNCLRVQIA